MDPKKQGISLTNVYKTMCDAIPSNIKLSEEFKAEIVEQTRRFVTFFTQKACNNTTGSARTTISHSDVVTAFTHNPFVFQQKVNAQQQGETTGPSHFSNVLFQPQHVTSQNIPPSMEQQQREAAGTSHFSNVLFQPQQQVSMQNIPPNMAQQQREAIIPSNFEDKLDTLLQQPLLMDQPFSSYELDASVSMAETMKRKRTEADLIRDIEELKSKVQRLENALKKQSPVTDLKRS